MAVGFVMADDGFDGRSPPQLSFDLTLVTALLARSNDPARLGSIVADITLVDIGPLDLAPSERFVSSSTSLNVWPS